MPSQSNDTTARTRGHQQGEVASTGNGQALSALCKSDDSTSRLREQVSSEKAQTLNRSLAALSTPHAAEARNVIRELAGEALASSTPAISHDRALQALTESFVPVTQKPRQSSVETLEHRLAAHNDATLNIIIDTLQSRVDPALTVGALAALYRKTKGEIFTARDDERLQTTLEQAVRIGANGEGVSTLLHMAKSGVPALMQAALSVATTSTSGQITPDVTRQTLRELISSAQPLGYDSATEIGCKQKILTSICSPALRSYLSRNDIIEILNTAKKHEKEEAAGGSFTKELLTNNPYFASRVADVYRYFADKRDRIALREIRTLIKGSGWKPQDADAQSLAPATQPTHARLSLLLPFRSLTSTFRQPTETIGKWLRKMVG